MTSVPLFYSGLAFGSAFLGARAQRLADLISAQGNEFFQAAGIVVPVRTVSTMLYLHHHGPSSLVQIAKALNEPHQVTAKRTSSLEGLAMVLCKTDPNDKRRRLFRLTKKGNRESTLIESRCRDALTVFENLNRELEINLGDALDAAYASLSLQSMLARSTSDTSDDR